MRYMFIYIYIYRITPAQVIVFRVPDRQYNYTLSDPAILDRPGYIYWPRGLFGFRQCVVNG